MVAGPQPEKRLFAPSAALWLKVSIGFALAVGVAYLVPGDDGGSEPPTRTLLIAGSLIALFTTGALYAGVRRDFGLPARIAIYAVAYNALIVLVKFVLAPRGLYEVNRSVDLTSLINIGDELGAAITAGVVFLLYLAAYYVVYWFFRQRIETLSRGDTAERKRRVRRLLVPVLAGALALAAAGGAFVLLIPVAAFSGGLEYLDFVFSSSVALLIALALAGATSLAVLAFRDVAERAELVGDAALLVSFFWLGLFFLALYHALWVVYVLVLTSIWPLKVVVPK